MEIIKIGKDGYKIVLSCEESEKYQLRGETKNQKAVEKLLKSQSVLMGFSDKITAQVFENKDGSTEIFILRESEGKRPLYREKELPTEQKKQRIFQTTVRFFSLNSLLLCISCLDVQKADVPTAVYYCEERKEYYLVLENVSSKELKYAFLSEFGKVVKNLSSSYIQEHFQCLCASNSIKIFANLL